LFVILFIQLFFSTLVLTHISKAVSLCLLSESVVHVLFHTVKMLFLKSVFSLPLLEAVFTHACLLIAVLLHISFSWYPLLRLYFVNT